MTGTRGVLPLLLTDLRNGAAIVEDTGDTEPLRKARVCLVNHLDAIGPKGTLSADLALRLSIAMTHQFHLDIVVSERLGELFADVAGTLRRVDDGGLEQAALFAAAVVEPSIRVTHPPTPGRLDPVETVGRLQGHLASSKPVGYVGENSTLIASLQQVASDYADAVRAEICNAAVVDRLIAQVMALGA